MGINNYFIKRLNIFLPKIVQLMPLKSISLFMQVTTEDQIQDGSLNVENVLWANTVLASGTALGIVVYTGRETRSVMNTTLPESKVGLLDLEVCSIFISSFFMFLLSYCQKFRNYI